MQTRFGQYDITRELGHGAMGMVYLAVHRSLQRECALKTIARKIRDPHAAERFIHEGQAVARLGKHPHIVQVFDAGIVDSTPYIAMEYVQGRTLDDALEQDGPVKEAELVEIGRKLALALDHAHRRGIVHRDVKPANIIIDTTGEPQLLDFGISKDLNLARPVGEPDRRHVEPPQPKSGGSTGSLVDAASTGAATIVLPDTGSPSPQQDGILGTPAYMAPEQADPRRGPVDARSDVYALGATLYVLATGQPLFDAKTLTDMLLQVVTVPPSPPGLFAEINPDLEAVILKALEKNPDNRYQTALEFADDLSRVTMGLPTRARKLGRMGWAWRLMRVHGRLVGIAAVFLVFAGVASAYYSYRSREIRVLWDDIAERTARATAQEVRSLLDPALPMLEECVSLSELGLLPVDNQEELAVHLAARFRFRPQLSWLSYGDQQGRFTGVWRHASGRAVKQRSWLDEAGGHVREQYIDGEQERLRWNDEWTYDPRTRPFYQLAAASDVPVWTKPYEWFGDEGLGITSALALRDPDSSEVRGVFTADYHLRSIADFLANLKLGSQGRAYLLGREGELLASPDRGATAADALLTAAIGSSRTTLSGGLQQLPVDEPRSFSFQHEKRSYVAAIEAFEPAAGLPIVTVVIVPEDDITGPLKAGARRTMQTVGSIALVAALLSILLGVWQKKRLVKSLSERRKAFQLTRGGQSVTEANRTVVDG